jgi:hypothetical protein
MQNFTHQDNNWDGLTLEEKNHRLFLQQRKMLDTIWEHGAISKEQHDKSLHDLAEKMGEVLD